MNSVPFGEEYATKNPQRFINNVLITTDNLGRFINYSYVVTRNFTKKYGLSIYLLI